jgi:hypothetical protein
MSTIHVGSDSFSGAWHLIETFVRLDTTRDALGGTQYLFVDDEAVAWVEHVPYRADKMPFGLNSVYVHASLDAAPQFTQTMYIDNLVVATRRVGAPGVPPMDVPSWPGATHRVNVPLVSAKSVHVDLSRTEEHLLLLKRCWSSEFYYMFADEICHLAWLYQLQVAHLVAFQLRTTTQSPPPAVAGLGAHAYTKWQTHGVIQVRLPDEKEGFFLGCDDGDGPSYKAELLAYHIDRLMAIDRVPATVARVVSEDEARSNLADKAVIASLKACTDDDVSRVVGSLSGWPHLDMPGVDVVSDFMNGHLYNGGQPQSIELEMSRLAVELLLTGLPRKIQTDSIVDVIEPGKGKKSAHHLFVNPANSMARWDHWSPLKPTMPACNRTASKSVFTCHLRLPPIDKHEKTTSDEFQHNEQVANGALLSYLQTACIFPRNVAMRLFHYGGKDVSLSATLAHVTKGEITGATALKRFKAPVLDLRVADIFSALAACVARLGVRSVIFDEPLSFRIHAPPQIHTDPAGSRFWKNATSGVWMKLAKAGENLPETATNEAPFLLSAAPFAELGCHLREECDGCLASSQCKWCMREMICEEVGGECDSGITVTNLKGCPVDGIKAAAPVAVARAGDLPYQLPQQEETEAPAAAADDYAALFEAFGGGKDEESQSQ